MLKRVAVILLVAGLIASAKTYSFNIESVTQAGTATLKPGEYRLKVDGPQVVLSDQTGRQIETTASVEPAGHKFPSTTLTISTENGTPKILEIGLGGSTNRVVFESVRASQ